GIQAIDLVQRKLPLGGGEEVHALIAELRGDAQAARASNNTELGETAARLDAALDDLEGATRYLQDALSGGKVEEALAGATPYLRLFGLAAGGAYLARGAVNGGEAAHATLARFFAENLVGETFALKDRVINGAASLEAASKVLVV
ncbi:MAG: acyl-CoA dehydrogenase C-terminal domain-containing protein, partial [Notoacmeibacter sp.]|nr:acyl-CoA dehydrogenase C-terminal domain-containing protein [Notoacmeibacter sp.]